MLTAKQIPFLSHASSLTSYHSPTQPNNLTVIALHGFTGSGQDFQPIVQLAQGHLNWYTLDLPGHGPNTSLITKDYSLELYLDAIHTVAQFYKLNQFILLGYSMGGRLALHYTIRYPTAVKALTLIGVSPGIEKFKERQERFKQDQKLSKWILKNDIKTFIDFWMQTPPIRSQKNIPPSLLHTFLERKYQHLPSGLSAALIGLSPGKIYSLWKEIKNITCPTLIISGEKDLEYIKIGKTMATLLQNACYLSIPEAGHCAHLENLPTFSKEFLNFLSSTHNEQKKF